MCLFHTHTHTHTRTHPPTHTHTRARTHTHTHTDFDMARELYSSDYYQMEGQQRKLPVRWMAPEALLQGKFSVESDIWSVVPSTQSALVTAAQQWWCGYDQCAYCGVQVVWCVAMGDHEPWQPALPWSHQPGGGTVCDRWRETGQAREMPL